MEKVLLIEPQNIPRQAISLFLFPEYEVEVKEAIGPVEAGLLSGYDLLIIDGSALQEKGQLVPETMRAIEVSDVPMLWLQEDDSCQPPKRDRVAIVKKPLERNVLQSAMADVLLQKGNRTAESSGHGESKDKPSGSRAEPGAQANPEFIELVDVVEEDREASELKKTDSGKSN